jgi:cyclase
MNMRNCFFAGSLVIMALAVSDTARAQVERPAPARTEIAKGVYLYRTAPYGGVGLDGNSIAIVGSNSVLVFDTNGTPSAAAAVLADLRTLTTQPVRYIVNSHWHWDHWYGTQVYREAFPDVQVIAQEVTKQMMMGPAIEFNEPGLERQLPNYIKDLESRVAAAEAESPPPAGLPRLKQALADARFFLGQKTAVRHTIPDRTFKNRLVLRLGDREVQVLHHDRAATPGDAFLYLPAEKILVTGDLLVNPISFALSSYPTTWLKTLEYLDSIDASVIVPGHGEPLRDERLLHATMDVFRMLLREGKAAKAKGVDVDTARDQIIPMLDGPKAIITGGDPAREDAFRIQLVDWFLHRVYEELDGPLSNAIAPIPVK